MAVVTNLKQIRKERNCYQRDIAVAVGSCTKNISNIERGCYAPSLELALRMARYLGVSVEELFEAEGE